MNCLSKICGAVNFLSSLNLESPSILLDTCSLIRQILWGKGELASEISHRTSVFFNAVKILDRLYI